MDKIPAQGIGYKIFKIVDDEYRPMFSNSTYKYSQDGWIKWRRDCGEVGFHFFLTEKEALACLTAWQRVFSPRNYKTVIRKIKYNQGMHKYPCHVVGNRLFETGFCGQFMIAAVGPHP